MPSLPMAPPTQRLPYLDSARGVAAMTVVLSHFYCAYHLPECLKILGNTPLRILWDGHGAVQFFFVLSGFVLAQPFLHKEHSEFPDMGKFFVRRSLRIFPAFWVALLVSAICKWVASLGFPASGLARPETWQWWMTSWPTPYGPSRVASEALLAWRPAGERILSQDWTLAIELTFSLFVPLLAVVARKQVLGMLLLVTTATLFMGTAPVLWAFAIGIVIARNHGPWVAWWQRSAMSYKLLILVSAVFLYNAWALFPAPHLHERLQMLSRPGAALMLMIILGSARVQRGLSLRPLILLGHLSYSLYLVHYIPILTVVPWTASFFSSLGVANGDVHYFLGLAVTVVVSLALAYPLWRWVELPGIRLAKFLTKARNNSSLVKAQAGGHGTTGSSTT